MTKEQLETNLAALKLLQNETNEKLADHKVQISLLEKQLEDINKPEITPMMIDEIHSAVEKAIEGFDFSNNDNYEFEFGMEYDGKVFVENVDLQCAYELTENIVDKVCNLFKEAECPTDKDESDETNK
tara:strand:- start:650 stop:1033 length:384 start_codon:yes stop_codon:yes gene_type:complete